MKLTVIVYSAICLSASMLNSWGRAEATGASPNVPNTAVTAPTAAPAPLTAAADQDGSGARWWQDHVEIGLRVTQVKLDDPTSAEGFVGTIDELEEDQTML
ncbi:MAG: hypothetical protein PHR35_13815, partial [Kiritimatiellae bacterium]|nr:hypothetical protein [Kiritimatiellia bacterium]